MQWLWNKILRGEGGISGDAMGMGKTITCIALMAALFSKEGTFEKDKKHSPFWPSTVFSENSNNIDHVLGPSAQIFPNISPKNKPPTMES